MAHCDEVCYVCFMYVLSSFKLLYFVHAPTENQLFIMLMIG